MAFHLQITLGLFLLCSQAFSQQRLGINTPDPQKVLDVSGSDNQYIRVHSSSAGFGAEAGIEFVRGPNNSSALDWKIVNDGGVFKINYGDNNFTTSGTEVLRMNGALNTGLGTNSPNTRLHVDGGTLLTFGGEGYMKIGEATGTNLAFDNTQIQALNNYNPASLYLQANGGHTHFGLNGGHTLMATQGGQVGVGTTAPDTKLTVRDDNFQWHISNDEDDPNDWFIGASNNGWQVGDDLLVFSPTTSSADAVLRLKNVTENDGTQAPVMIYNTNDHTLLLDGNEIDTRGTPLYINYNTEEETYVNPTGGRVGIGTTNPQAMLHVYIASGNALTLQSGNSKWHFNPVSSGDQDLSFVHNSDNFATAWVDGTSGQWNHISDARAKEAIELHGDVMPMVKGLVPSQYTFKHDSLHQMRIGVIAQDAIQVCPEIVSVNEDQYGVSYGQLAVIGIKAVQEQQSHIEVLREKIRLIKAMIQDDPTEIAPSAIHQSSN
jgi:hypothetical protein